MDANSLKLKLDTCTRKWKGNIVQINGPWNVESRAVFVHINKPKQVDVFNMPDKRTTTVYDNTLWGQEESIKSYMPAIVQVCFEGDMTIDLIAEDVVDVTLGLNGITIDFGTYEIGLNKL